MKKFLAMFMVFIMLILCACDSSSSRRDRDDVDDDSDRRTEERYENESNDSFTNFEEEITYYENEDILTPIYALYESAIYNNPDLFWYYVADPLKHESYYTYEQCVSDVDSKHSEYVYGYGADVRFELLDYEIVNHITRPDHIKEYWICYYESLYGESSADEVYEEKNKVTEIYTITIVYKLFGRLNESEEENHTYNVVIEDGKYKYVFG